MSAKVTFTLDGRQVEAAEGTLVIEAAKAAGVEVPHYCYHPALGNPGVCRLCVVEVEGMPKLQVSCRLPVKAGMVVRSNSPAARKGQASSLEFHLANHPLDCPVCDQAGECWLQDYYMKFGLYASSVTEDKRHKQKRLDIGANVMLDNERCILCTRCTRFLDDVTKTHELGIFERGDRSQLLPYPGMRVDNPYAGNVIDLCPVGALTDKDFRFQVRVWYLDRTPSICHGCARGCAIEAHTNTKRPWHSEGRRLLRLKPRHNPEVNGYWMCDEGRYGYHSVDADTRLSAASLLESGGLARVSWEAALPRISAELEGLAARRGPEGLAVLLSASLSNEDLYAARLLFAEKLKAGWILVTPGPDQLGEEDELLRRREKVANLRGARALGFGSRVKEASPKELAQALKDGRLWGLYAAGRDPLAVLGAGSREPLSRLEFTAFHGANANLFTDVARWVLPASAWAEDEGTLANFEGQVQRFSAALSPLGDARPEWSVWGAMLEAGGGRFPHQDASGVFAALCAAEPEFAGLSWDGLGVHGRRLSGSPREPEAALR